MKLLFLFLLLLLPLLLPSAGCAPVDPIQQRCLYQAELAVLPDMNVNNPDAISQIGDLRGACEQANGE